jgi:hypothetical protein
MAHGNARATMVHNECQINNIYNSTVHSGVLLLLTTTLHSHKRITLLQIHRVGRCATECRRQEGGQGMR